MNIQMNSVREVKYHAKGYDTKSKLGHSHGNFYEIWLCHAGSGQIMISDKLYPFASGTMYILNTSNLHCTIPLNTDTYERSMIMYDGIYMETLFNLAGMPNEMANIISCFGGVCLQLDNEASRYVDRRIKNINNLYNNVSGCASDCKKAHITVQSILLLARVLFERQAVINSVKRSSVAMALDYIKGAFGGDISITHIAKEVGLNESYLCRLFKKNTNMTITQYIIGRRLSLAKSMLANSSCSVTEISLECGFNDVSYFCRTFTKHEGLTPTAYREKNFLKI